MSSLNAQHLAQSDIINIDIRRHGNDLINKFCDNKYVIKMHKIYSTFERRTSLLTIVIFCHQLKQRVYNYLRIQFLLNKAHIKVILQLKLTKLIY